MSRGGEYRGGGGYRETEIDQLRKSLKHDFQDLIEAIKGMSQPPAPSGSGHFAMHVTEVVFKEEPMPTPDVTPPLDLASTSVRAKISVVNPRKPGNERITTVDWSVSEESPAGALPLESAPDDTVKDENGAEVLDPVDNLPLAIFSVYANTPLSPEPGQRASGLVTVRAPGMVDCTKKVTYGDAPLGHFTMVGTEAPEV